MTRTNLPTPFVHTLISSYSGLISIGVITLTVINIIYQRSYIWQPDLLASQLIIGISTALIPIFIKSNYKKIALISPILEDITYESNPKQLSNKIKRIEKSVWADIFPIAVTLLGTYTLYLFGSPWRFAYPFAHNIFSIFVFIFFFIAGSLGWQYISLIAILYSASKMDVNASIFAWPARQVKRLNQITIEIYFAGTAIYIGAILSIWTLPWGNFFLTNDNLFTRLWVFPIAIIVIIYFLTTQYLIHRIIVTSKDIRLEKIDAELENLIEKKNKVNSETNIKLISELISWRRKIEDASEWPFNIQTSLGIIGGVLLPTIGSISDLFIKLFR
ncbi:MAG: hypothetical protein JETCAE01_03520 [Anaerolineaceae bacterium]|nr:MAG: hypothetical protein JETCAE01_03520 [Anaerolineaceae bacterium]